MSINFPISFNICFGCSKELSHLDGPFELSKHNIMLWLRNTEINFFVIPSYNLIKIIRPE